MASLLSLGTSGLNAANVALRTTGHNIANVNTPGFSRQVPVVSTPVPQFSGSGYFGRGAQVETIRRVYDAFLVAQAHGSTARAGEAAMRADLLHRADAILGATDAGIPASLRRFESAMAAASDHPDDLAARQAALAAADSLAGTFSDTADRLSGLRSQIDSQLAAQVVDVNRMLRDVASLNQQIVLSQGAGQPPNDLLDQRDLVVRQLSATLGVTTVAQDDGSLSLFTGNGQSLVLGARASTLEVQPDNFDPRHPVLAIRNAGTVYRMDTRELAGGSLTGLLRFADEDLAKLEDGVGRAALALATAYNDRHRLGLDADGVAGGDLFAFAGPAAFPKRDNAGTGTIAATVADPTRLAASGYRIDYDGSQYTLTRLADGNRQSFATLPQTVDGLTFALSGTPVAGDAFTVNAVRDVGASMRSLLVRPAALALALPVAAAAGAANGGSLTIQAVAVPGPSAGANLTQPVTIRFTSATTFDVTGNGTGNPAGLAYTAGGTIAFNGWSIRLDGTPAAGDVVTVAASGGRYGDNGNGLAMGELAARPFVDGFTLDEALAGLYAHVGTLASSWSATADAQEAVRVDTIGAEQALSGVNLDEEAARLLQFQQAYQAAAKIISAAQVVFDTLLDIGR
jgi:flagellar hook-associated protein 1 FlgK